MSTATKIPPAGLSNTRVAELLGPDRRSALYVAERTECEYGTHWWWGGTQAVYTPAGLRAIADFFERRNDASAAEILRREAEQLASIIARMAAAPEFPTRRLPYKDDED